MAYDRTLVCLATSRKPHGRCIAGKELMGMECGAWIRPVSSRPKHEISIQNCCCHDGTQPRLLHVLTVPMLSKTPHQHQVENETIDEKKRWVKGGLFPWASVPAFLDYPASLWKGGYSSRVGRNDKVPANEVSASKGSLLLIEPLDLRLCVLNPYPNAEMPRRVVRAAFGYGSREYNLPVTDPDVEHIYLSLRDGEYKFADKAYLTVSLTEQYNDSFCYKLVAAIVTERGFS